MKNLSILTDAEIAERLLAIKAQVEPLIEERTALEQESIRRKSQFQVGDTIQWKAGKSFRRGRVDEIEEWVCDQPCWVVTAIRKNGSMGEQCTVRSYMDPAKL